MREGQSGLQPRKEYQSLPTPLLSPRRKRGKTVKKRERKRIKAGLNLLWKPILRQEKGKEKAKPKADIRVGKDEIGRGSGT